MKIRNGFVSNSSSSSFILLMKEISPAEIKNINDKNIEGIFARGMDMGEGRDFFRLDEDMKDFVLKHFDPYENEENSNLTFYVVYWRSESGSISINKQVWDKIGKSLPNENILMGDMDISYHSTDGLESLKSNYFPHIDDEAKELEVYNKLKEDVKQEKERTKILEKSLKEMQKKLKIKGGQNEE